MATPQVHFDQHRRNKAARENRDIPLRTVAEETGLALSTVHRVSKGQVGKVYLSTLTTLCDYLGVSLCELVDYAPGAGAGAGTS